MLISIVIVEIASRGKIIQLSTGGLEQRNALDIYYLPPLKKKFYGLFPLTVVQSLKSSRIFDTIPQKITSGLLKHIPCPNGYIFIFNKLYLIFFVAIRLKTMLKFSRVLCFSRGDSCQNDFTSVINLMGLWLL